MRICYSSSFSSVRVLLSSTRYRSVPLIKATNRPITASMRIPKNGGLIGAVGVRVGDTSWFGTRAAPCDGCGVGVPADGADFGTNAGIVHDEPLPVVEPPPPASPRIGVGGEVDGEGGEGLVEIMSVPFFGGAVPTV